MGAARADAGDLDAAVDELQRALTIQEQNLGPESIGTFLANLAVVRERQGQLVAARDFATRARALREKLLRPGHPDRGYDLYILAGIAADRGDLDEADALADQALTILVPAASADSTNVADVQEIQALIALQRHDLLRGRQLIETALSSYRRALGTNHPSVANAECVLGAILLEVGQAGGALPMLEHALAVEEGARADDAADVVVARTVLADALLATGDPGRARVLAERAVLATKTRRQRADIFARALFVLAKTIDTSDRPRAIELARQARAALVDWPAGEGDRSRIDRWLTGRS
jgi:tetratricopeptide (TPR) repeat protein